MNKLVFFPISVMLFLSGCATLSDQGPTRLTCPVPLQLPELDKLPAEVMTPSFSDRLEKRMFRKPTEQTSFDFTLRPATGTTIGLKPPLNP